MTRDLSFFVCGTIWIFAGGHAQRFQPRVAARPNILAVFADSAGEDKQIHAAHESDVRPIVLRMEVVKMSRASAASGSLARARSSRLFTSLSPFERAKRPLAWFSTSSNSSVLVISFRSKKEQDTRIQVAGARAHRDPACGRHAHRGVDRLAVAQCAQARSIAQVREDRAGGEARAEVVNQRCVGEPVKAVASHAGVQIRPGNAR